MNKKRARSAVVIYAIILIVGFLLINKWLGGSSNVATNYSYTEFSADLNAGNIATVDITQNTNVPTATVDVEFVSGKQLTFYAADVNEIIKIYNDYEAAVDKKNATASAEDQVKLAKYNLYDVQKESMLGMWIPYLIIMIIMVIIMTFMIGRIQGGGSGGQMMNFGKSRAKKNEDIGKTVTFKDVAGLDEEKEDLEEIVSFLKNPGRFVKVGARIPKGVLLVGPPGTGKTLLAKALAGEAGVPFFSLSGSDFVEMFVGVGASRVRDLFKQATSMAPCIIFIDEIDAIGKSRDSQYGGGNDEREQTLNQLLSEMDGFDSSKGIIILGATNRPEVLDKALLRPGRFDRRIIVEKPDLKGRVDVLKVHSHDVLMDDTVDLEEIALATSGAVGADLANMVNEAAIMAVKDGRQVVSQKDLFEAVEVVLAGKEKKDRILGEEEKKIVAYHEIGHALVATNLKHAEPVQKITIVPRTMGALGYVMQVPEEEKYLMKKEELISEIVTLMGGRAAEQVKFDDITTGASNDIEKATSIARSMVTQYGMSSKFGMMGLETIQSRYLDGRPVLNCGEVTESQIDEEVMTILNDCYKKAVECIETNQTVMDKLAEHLIEKETITGKEFVAIYEEITGEKLKRSGEEKQKEEVKELPQNEEE